MPTLHRVFPYLATAADDQPVPRFGACSPEGRARARSLPAGSSELTMAQYTSLRVELHLLPDRAASVLGRYGIRPEGKEALFAHWRARFEADPALRMWFARDYARYLAWVRENPAALEGIT